jgi:hypothetical protein
MPESLPRLERATAELTRLRGPAHPETRLSRAKLARARNQAGNLEAALGDYKKLLPDLLGALGREYAGTLHVGTTRPIDVKSVDTRGAIAEYEKRVQYLLDRVRATYSRLI